MSRLTRNGTAEPVSRDQFSGANGDREILIFPVELTTSRNSNKPYPVDPYSARCDDHTYIRYTNSRAHI